MEINYERVLEKITYQFAVVWSHLKLVNQGYPEFVNE